MFLTSFNAIIIIMENKNPCFPLATIVTIENKKSIMVTLNRRRLYFSLDRAYRKYIQKHTRPTTFKIMLSDVILSILVENKGRKYKRNIVSFSVRFI